MDRPDGNFTTLSGEPVKPLYTASDLPPADTIGEPGQYPFTRGVYPSMYRGKLWTMRQFAGFGTAEETNERFRYLLEHGQTGLSTAFDMPSLMGYDSDHPRSLGEVGREGVAIDTAADMERLFAGIPLDDVTVSMTDERAGGDHAGLLRRRGRAPGGAARGPRRHDPDRHPQGVHRPEGVVLPGRSRHAPGRRHDRVVLAAHAALAPGVDLGLPHPRGAARPPCRSSRSRSRTGSPTSIRRSRGASTSTTSRRGSRSSSTPTSTSSRRSPSTAPPAGSGRASCATPTGRSDPRSLLMRFHTQTAGVSLTAQQPLLNVVRTTIEALAGVLGGTQSLHTNSYDEALALPDRGCGPACAAHPADHRLRDRRGVDRRPARRLVLRRGADRPARGGRVRVLRRDRRHGRDGRGGQAKLSAARDRRGRLRAAGRDRGGGADGGRRQSLRPVRGGARRDPLHRSGARAEADPAGARRPRRARRGRRRGRAWRPCARPPATPAPT